MQTKRATILVSASLGLAGFWGCGETTSSTGTPSAGAPSESAVGGQVDAGDAPGGAAPAGLGGEASGGVDAQASGGIPSQGTGGTGASGAGGSGNGPAQGIGGDATGGVGSPSAGGRGGEATGGTDAQATGGSGNSGTGGSSGDSTGGAGNAPSGGTAGYPVTGGTSGYAGMVGGSSGAPLAGWGGASAGAVGTNSGAGGEGTGGQATGVGGGGGSSSICSAPPEHVRCDTPGAVIRYRYVELTDCCGSHGFECSEFCTTVGAGFATHRECRAACGGWAPRLCGEQPDPGSCDQALLRYAFDRITGLCEQFVYGGCEGNENNFTTEAECMAICEGGPEPCQFARDYQSPCIPGQGCGVCIQPYNSCDGSCLCMGAAGGPGVWQCWL